MRSTLSSDTSTCLRREIVFLALLTMLLSSCTKPRNETVVNKLAPTVVSAAKQQRRKVLFVDSYHPEFGWVADITTGITRSLEVTLTADGKPDPDTGKVELKILHMDTKRNQSEAFKVGAANKAKALIESWKPDVVIAADDNASKYLIVPYFKNSSLPFVFCGVNWDASPYGFPCANVTGMVEVTLFPQLLDILKPYAQGERLAMLASDTLSERKNVANYKEIFGVKFNEHYAKTFDDWKHEYIEAQKRCDMLVLLECESVKGFDKSKAIDFILANTSTPTGSMESFLKDYAMVSCAKRGDEQGEWAANTALAILDGKKPSDFPIARNRNARIYLNMRIARKLGVKFPIDLINRSTMSE